MKMLKDQIWTGPETHVRIFLYTKAYGNDHYTVADEIWGRIRRTIPSTEAWGAMGSWRVLIDNSSEVGYIEVDVPGTSG